MQANDLIGNTSSWHMSCQYLYHKYGKHTISINCGNDLIADYVSVLQQLYNNGTGLFVYTYTKKCFPYIYLFICAIDEALLAVIYL